MIAWFFIMYTLSYDCFQFDSLEHKSVLDYRGDKYSCRKIEVLIVIDQLEQDRSMFWTPAGGNDPGIRVEFHPFHSLSIPASTPTLISPVSFMVWSAPCEARLVPAARKCGIMGAGPRDSVPGAFQGRR